MIERLLIAAILILVGFLLYKIFTGRQLHHARTAFEHLEGIEAGKYLILYFTSPTCVSCRTAQRPALRRVQEVFGDQVQIITIDVTEQPATAEYWNVMTLPTTYLFDATGQPSECNLGVAYADRLIQQLTSMGATTPQLQQTSA